VGQYVGVRDAVGEIADRLYLLPPERFVAERSAAVAQARAAGDTRAAAALTRLRRPTVAAWLVNLLALRRPELLTDLAELARSLRTAQRDLRGEQMRELSTQRRAVVSALVATARSLATEATPDLGGKLPLGEVETTLNAALADEELAEVVRSGRLVRAVAYEGFGEVPRPQLRLVAGETEAGETEAGEESDAAEGAGDTRPARPGRAALRAAVRRELAAAQEEAAAVEADLERAAAVQRDSEQALAEIDAALADLTARRATAVAELAGATTAHQSARRALVAARRRLGDAEAAAGGITDGD
jgi:hypothetical protein